MASAPGWCLWRSRLPLPDPADVVDAHAPSAEVEAHAHHVEARVLWEGDVRHDGGAHAHGGAARGDLTVTHPLDVIERELPPLGGHGQDADGHGQIALHAGQHVLPRGGVDVGEADVLERLGGDGHAVAGIVSRDEGLGLPPLADGGGRRCGCAGAHGVPLSGRVEGRPFLLSDGGDKASVMFGARPFAGGARRAQGMSRQATGGGARGACRLKGACAMLPRSEGQESFS